MDIQEAIEILSNFDMQVTAKADGAYQTTIGEKACKYAIDALKEFEQYRQIGTVDECRAAKEKQIPQIPEMVEAQSQGLIGDGTHTDKVSYQSDAYECPNCGSFLGFKIDCCDDDHYQDNFCSVCGQALKWGD